MPELPEVQTIVNDLQTLTGDTITGFWTKFKKAVKTDQFEKKITGNKIISVMRIGKNIVIKFADKKALLIHLKMTGKLIVAKNGARHEKQQAKLSNFQTNHKKTTLANKHLHHVFYLKKHGALEFYDIRKFATLELISQEDLLKIKEKRGIDPLSKDFTIKKFTQIIRGGKNKTLKSLLLDQSSISGIGNIYASEIPFGARINPHRLVRTLTEKEISKLRISTLKILKKAIIMRGTSISDYRDTEGKRGGFQKYLKVYGKTGKKCADCGTIIEKMIIGQRSTFYCPKCQK